MLQEIREIMNLTVAQVADELGMPQNAVIAAEEADDPAFASRMIAAFPINPAILADPGADPFLPSYDQGTTPGERLKAWKEMHHLTDHEFTAMLRLSPEELAELESDENRISRKRGVEIERLTGINRKWLMYGDGREKGEPLKERTKKPVPVEVPSARIPVQAVAPDRELGERIRRARKSLSLSMKAASEKVGVAYATLSRYECGYVSERKTEELIRKMTEREEGEMSPGERVRAAREVAGLTQKEVGEMVGLASVTISAMEADRVSGKRADEVIAAIEAATKKDLQPASSRTIITPTLKRDSSMGRRIRNARKEAGLSQKTLAAILHISESSLAAIELGDVTEERAKEILKRIEGKPRHEVKAKQRPKASRQILLGWQIRDARKNAGLSQKEVADLIGSTQSAVSLMERGQVDEETATEVLRLIAEDREQDSVSFVTDDTDTRKEYGLKLRELRKSTGLTVKAASDLLDIKPARLTQIECGKVGVKICQEMIGLLEKKTKQDSKTKQDRKTPNAESEGPWEQISMEEIIQNKS